MKITSTISSLILAIILSGIVKAQNADTTNYYLTLIDQEVQELVNNTQVVGATATIYFGNDYHSYTRGEVSTGIVTESDRWYLTRSLTKLMVSTIIFQLQEEGALNINNAIEDYIDPLPNVDGSLTLHELLSMRANICDFLTNSWGVIQQNPNAILNTRTILESTIPSESCNSEKSYSYNDSNFQILGLIIEAVTGNNGEEEFNNRIFSQIPGNTAELAPVNASADQFNGLWSFPNGLGGNPVDVNQTSKNSILTAHKFNGGVVGSTQDMLSFVVALLEGRLTSKESLEEMKPVIGNGYGLGMMQRNLSGNFTVFGHGGGGLNSSRTFYHQEEKIGVSVAGNFSDSDNMEVTMQNIFSLLRTCREGGGCKEKISEHDELVGELQQILDDNIPTYGIEGVATTIVFPNEEVHTIGSGHGQNVNDPVDLDKSWHWASGTKPMTGFVTLKLIEDGVLSIDDPVGKFLDTNSIPNLDSTITVKRLLQHTSGLSEIWSSTNNSTLWQEVWNDRDSVWNPREFLNYMPAPFDGLTEHYYASTNSYILSFIIEEVTGKSLEENFQKFIFNPLAMTSSYLSTGKDIDMSEFNGAWLGNENRSTLSHTSYLSSRSGNSAHIATSEDQVKFYRSYYSGELLSSDLMDDVKVPADGSSEVIFENYACISKVTQLHGYETTMFEVIDIDGHAWNLYGHGGNGIHNSFTYHWEQKDLTIAMVINDFQVLEPSPLAALIFDVLCKIDEEIDDIPVSNEEEDQTASPVDFTLSQNYPNPFNPTTNISFELPIAGSVQLKVYNMLGQEVANLVDGRLNQGNHTVNFDASQLSSGVYIYRLVAGDQAITKKMMLIK